MIPLGDFIDTELKKVHARSYHEEAPARTELPFAVYKFPNSTENFQREDFILEIEVFGTAPYTRGLEQLVENIDQHMHRLQHYEDGEVQCSIYRINRLALPDPDPTIRRRQLRYRVDTYLL